MEKYQVFISFRGEDTRTKFTSYFYSQLCQKKIETYIDDRLEKGDAISPALLRAIEGSKISVVVFSENYACSSWCLHELVHIMECRHKYGQIVVPVFYEVDPSHVRKQSNSYEAALAMLRERFEEKVLNKWRDALSEAANIAGWDSSLYRRESEFVEEIVDDILRKLSHASRSDDSFKDIIGIDKSVEQVETLLSIDSTNIKMLGIWGMGGVGKTTLAHVIFKRLSSRFEGCCFLANVREESEKHKIDDLKVELVSELLKDDGLKRITSFAEDKLRRTKVLIVLDDVNDPEHLEVLAGDHDWFGPGSRIIVTTRDAQVLRDRADEKFELKGLNFYNALKLFYLSAFKRSSPTPEDIELSERVVNYVEGIPLALKVLGSFLRSKRKENWNHELNKLKEVPNKKIHNVLKVSYDGLDKTEKCIFLDIACFFTGQVCRDYVECIIGGPDLFVHIGIDNLIDKCLISIEDNNLVMHDLIREMGWEIVKQQSIEEPGKRSRICSATDLFHLLKNNTGTPIVEGISLQWGNTSPEVDLSPTVFRSMYKLRFLNFNKNYSPLQLPQCFQYIPDTLLNFNRNYSPLQLPQGLQYLPDTHLNFNRNYSPLQLPQGLQYLPDTLTCLVWFYYPLKSLPSDFVPHSLVELRMPYSELEQLWTGVPDLWNLKHIDLRYSDCLTELPDLSRALNLESVNVSSCPNLRKFSSRLRFRDVEKLTSFSQIHRKCNHNECRTLRSLDLSGCKSLQILPKILGTVKELHLNSTPIEELPSSIRSLESLEYLDMSGCSVLKNLPSDIRKLKSLKNLNLNKCYSMDNIPELPMSIVNLSLEEIKIAKLQSSSIENLSCLEKLDLSACTRLSSLPSNIWKLKTLKHLKFSTCWKLVSLPKILEPMEHLETLSLSRSGIRMLPSGIENLIKIQNLEMLGCRFLEILPLGISKLIQLRKLSLSGCSKLKYLPPLTADLRSLTNLNLSHCNLLEIPNGIGFLVSLEKLVLSGNAFEGVPESIKQLCKLVEFEVCNCENLKSLPELPLSLEFLDFSGCINLEIISDSSVVLTQEWWDNYNSPRSEEFFFYYNCLKLDKNLCNNVVTEFQIRSLHKATVSVSKHGELKKSDYARVGVCCPGEMIPEWFNYQSESSSIKVTLPSCQHSTDFLGVALFAIIASKDFYDFENFEAVSCDIHLKTNNGQSRKFYMPFTHESLRKIQFPTQQSYSNNMFMWYNYENYLNWHDATEISFQFHLKASFKRGNAFSGSRYQCTSYRDNWKVTSCGIRLLYVQDVEELGFATKKKHHIHGYSNVVGDDPNSSGNWTTNFNTDKQSRE